MIEYLPHFNVCINTVTLLLLFVGRALAKRKKDLAHRNVMLLALALSGIFLASYLTYHYQFGSKKFPADPSVAVARVIYLIILATHTALAAIVPFVAACAVYLGLKGNRVGHRKVVRWFWPVWVYVLVTGIIVYLMLYQIYV